VKQSEVIYPKEEVGIFRGEAVYARSSVISVKTSENWIRMGRKVKEGCQAMKMVKAHAMTKNRRRAIEMARIEGEEIGMQGLYALDQTELYVPLPIIDVRKFIHLCTC
jgi:xeroderma pigmentosum group C-complementing protein